MAGMGHRQLAEQTILVTGATDGLGKALARELAARGSFVLLHGRSRARLDETLHGLRRMTGSDRVRPYLADFSSLEDVRRMAQNVAGENERVDLLINNAGIGFGTPGGGREESRDGYELRFAVNYLAPFLLTTLLLPRLQESAPARIVNVASAGQQPVDFHDVMLEHRYDGVRAYRQSKLALVMFTFELAERLRAEGEQDLTVNALHPATFMDTKMVRDAGVAPANSVEQGLAATLRLAISPELDGVSGRYFDGMREARALDQAYDPQARARLRRLSEELVAQSLRPASTDALDAG